ncbi:heme A synthase [Pontibacillus halophilus JSM 076056 = DSM 19796]|uniref:Heme A synthase n=1 Tax=Pontibacillus halophilus JSM 076056 = DSM 19796 TaxID=1385510 RepID=A0A0A5IBT2_9BACI|nr:heme A synthase [Pontibacillus halophilus]KGX93302.1 heme A synthase [Pontibacillus halophilus JSM 076056 = DSM 19796]
MMKLLKFLSVLSSLGMLFVLIGGALVTKTESGMGCGRSWPLCHGQLIPSNITPELIIELSHRVVSGGVGFLVLLMAIIAWRKIGHKRETKLLAILSVFFLVLQGLIGAAAVVFGQNDFTLAAHFGISLISFASILLLTLLVFEVDLKFDAKSLKIDSGLRKHFYGITLYTLAVTYTGALVRHTEAQFACGSFPFCSNYAPGDWNFSFIQTVQMGHRLAAGVLVIWVIYLLFRITKSYRHSQLMFGGWVVATTLIFLQGLTGAMTVMTLSELLFPLFHALIISIFFGLLTYFVLLSNRSAKYEKEMLQSSEAKQQQA